MGFHTPHWNWVRLPSGQAQVYTLLADIRTIPYDFHHRQCWVSCIMKTLFHKHSPIVPPLAKSASLGLMGLGDAKTKKCGVLLHRRIHKFPVVHLAVLSKGLTSDAIKLDTNTRFYLECRLVVLAGFGPAMPIQASD